MSGSRTSATTWCVPEGIKKTIEGFRHDAHPMGMFLSTVGALGTFYPDAKDISDPATRRLAAASG